MEQLASTEERRPFDLYVSANVASNAALSVVSSVRSTPAQQLWYSTQSKSEIDWLEFSLLAAQWKQDTRHMSSLRQVFASRYYQRILEMGADRIVPLIIRQLIVEGSQPYHWFAPRTVLTKQDPAQGRLNNVRDISQAWIDWGRARYGSELGPD